MIKEIYTLYVERWHFFLDLTWEHLQISLMSIVIATMVGLGLGIMISMYRKSSSTVLGLTNFIYTIPSIALFGFLIPFSGIGTHCGSPIPIVLSYIPFSRAALAAATASS